MSTNILQNKKITGALVIVWLFLSVLNIASTPQDLNSLEHGDKQENTTDSGDSEKVVVKLTEAVQSTTSINLNFQSFLLDEVLQTEDSEEYETAADYFHEAIKKHVRILFRLIISPNAP